MSRMTKCQDEGPWIACLFDGIYSLTQTGTLQFSFLFVCFLLLLCFCFCFEVGFLYTAQDDPQLLTILP